MKILHTSDLHLGKKLNGKITRYDEQIELLKEDKKMLSLRYLWNTPVELSTRHLDIETW